MIMYIQGEAIGVISNQTPVAQRNMTFETIDITSGSSDSVSVGTGNGTWTINTEGFELLTCGAVSGNLGASGNTLTLTGYNGTTWISIANGTNISNLNVDISDYTKIRFTQGYQYGGVPSTVTYTVNNLVIS